jgi:hypothetical protein
MGRRRTPVTAGSQDRQSAAPESVAARGTDRAKSEIRNFAEQQKAAGADQIAGFAQAADATANKLQEKRASCPSQITRGTRDEPC